jgi:hypothetical protein
VVILDASEYDRLKELDRRAMRLDETGKGAAGSDGSQTA